MKICNPRANNLLQESVASVLWKYHLTIGTVSNNKKNTKKALIDHSHSAVKNFLERDYPDAQFFFSFTIWEGLGSNTKITFFHFKKNHPSPFLFFGALIFELEVNPGIFSTGWKKPVKNLAP